MGAQGQEGCLEVKAAPSLHSQHPRPHGTITESWVREGAAFKALPNEGQRQAERGQSLPLKTASGLTKCHILTCIFLLPSESEGLGGGESKLDGSGTGRRKIPDRGKSRTKVGRLTGRWVPRPRGPEREGVGRYSSTRSLPIGLQHCPHLPPPGRARIQKASPRSSGIPPPPCSPA